MTKKIIIQLTIILMIIASCRPSETEQPRIEDYQLGETWVWKYKGVTTKGEVRSEGTDTRVIVKADNALGITIGKDTIPLTDIVKPEESKTPKYDWPLVVGKKWIYENRWTSQDGTSGKQSQDVEILSFKEETVEAGTFMAYTIEYKGEITNSRGYKAAVEEVWLYAPKVKNFIKLTQKQEDFLYIEELIEHSIEQKKP